MTKRLRPKLTYANTIATLALFLALGGGAAYAAQQLGKNTVGAKQLKRNSVTAAKVKDGSLQPEDFKAGTLPVGERGPQGAPGAPGAPGATDVVVRYGEYGKPKDKEEVDFSLAECAAGEAVTGGGFDFLGEPVAAGYTLLANRPSGDGVVVDGVLVYSAPSEGSPALGWETVIRNDADDTIFFRAYAMCARP